MTWIVCLLEYLHTTATHNLCSSSIVLLDDNHKILKISIIIENETQESSSNVDRKFVQSFLGFTNFLKMLA